MKPKLIFCLALVLSASHFCCCNNGIADESATTPSPSAQPTGHLYRDAQYGLQLILPQGWEARETSLSVSHYDYVFLTINNQRPGLSFEGWEGTWICNKRVNTVGPFWQYGVNDVVLNEDGSAAFLIAGTNMQSYVPLSGDALREKLLSHERVHAQIVVLNANGRIRFQTDCGTDVRSPIVAPNGAGVLLRSSTVTNQNTFMWFTVGGVQRFLKISPNPEFLGWIPETCQSLFSTSIGSQSGPYELIDWNTGKEVWDIPCPGRGEVLATALTPKLILFSVAEPYPSGTWHKVNESLFQSGKEWVRTFYAVDVQDGKPIARWQGQFPHRYSGKIRDHFLQLGDKLYYVTADEFTKLNLKDIMAGATGWQ